MQNGNNKERRESVRFKCVAVQKENHLNSVNSMIKKTCAEFHWLN